MGAAEQGPAEHGAGLQAFDELLAAIAECAQADDQQALARAFVERYPTAPLVSETEAVILYWGPAESVLLRGDMLQERSAPLIRLAHTQLWFHRGSYAPDARLDYHLLVDGRDLGDPRNPRHAPSGYGPRAELRMPRYAAHELWQPRTDVPQGTLAAFAGFSSTVYPSTRTVWVYTPPGYQAARQYPCVYFHDGGDYLRFAHAAALFDNLINANWLEPCIGVFVDPSCEHGREADYDLNQAYVRFFVDELVPWVDGRFATARQPEQRVVVGASFGGLIALAIGLQRPDVFGCVAAQSSFASRRDAAIIKRFAASPSVPLKLDLIVGTYEMHIGPRERASSEADFVRGNRALRDVLAERGYSVAYAEYPEGHSWGLWRARLGSALRFLLAPIPPPQPPFSS